MRSAKAKAAVALKESAVASEGGNTTADSATEDSGTEEEKRKKGTKATKRKAPPNKRTVKRRGKAQDLEEEEAQGLKAGSHQGSPKSVKEKEASTSEEDSCGEDKENESEDVDETEDEESVGPEDVPPDAKRASCGMLDCDFECSESSHEGDSAMLHLGAYRPQEPPLPSGGRMPSPLLPHGASKNTLFWRTKNG